MKVKICGVTRMVDALLAEKLGADAIGFIFYNKSKRYISPDKASEIIKSLSPFTLKVGVFVNEIPGEINRISSLIKLNAVQLHGNEIPEIVNEINFPVIKSFRINSGFNFNTLNNFQNVSILLDSYSEKEFGGTGIKFNWDLIPKELEGNFILSGGISVDNVEEINYKVKPKAIDISSSLETFPGIKDHNKLKEFFQKINFIRSQVC